MLVLVTDWKCQCSKHGGYTGKILIEISKSPLRREAL